jgi:hypothetical protein
MTINVNSIARILAVAMLLLASYSMGKAAVRNVRNDVKAEMVKASRVSE